MTGERVELDHTSDPYTALEPGMRGSVTGIDGVGTVHVHWDNGSNLGLVPGEDRWHVVTDEDMASSASRQHFIDTGRYLPLEGDGAVHVPDDPDGNVLQ